MGSKTGAGDCKQLKELAQALIETTGERPSGAAARTASPFSAQLVVPARHPACLSGSPLPVVSVSRQ